MAKSKVQTKVNNIGSKKTEEEQNEFVQLNNGLSFKTTTMISTDTKVNPFVSKAKMVDGTNAFDNTPTSVKAAYDAQDERTLSGNNWDKATISIVSKN